MPASEARPLIRPAISAADFAAFGRLITDYVAWCRGRYRDASEVIDAVFGHQSLATELRALQETYGAPNGVTLLASEGGDVGAAGAVRWLADGSSEMKRVFVGERLQGRGLGRRLCEALVAAAREHGSTLVRIDTGSRFTEALSMYESLGFRRCAPHRDYPGAVLPHLVFMELPLDR